MTQDDVQSFEENPLPQANKQTNTTFTVLVSEKRKTKQKNTLKT